MATIVRAARCGIYFRVLREGEAEAGTRMELLERPLPQWPIARVFRLLIGGGHKGDPDAVRALADMPVLAEAWRERARKLARSEEHTSELQSLMRISYAVFCLKKKKKEQNIAKPD